MVKFGDILRHARRESVGTSFVWCHSDRVLTKNPFLLAERGKVLGRFGSIEEFFLAAFRSFRPGLRPSRLPGRFRRGTSTSAARTPSTGRAFLGGPEGCSRRFILGRSVDSASNFSGRPVRLAARHWLNQLGRVLLLSWMEKRLRRARYFLLFLCGPLFLHTIFRISTAPEPRYFGSTPWLFAAAPILSFIAAEGSLAFLCLVANLYLCAVPMAALLVDTSWQWAKRETRFPEIPRAKMAKCTNPAGLRCYAPKEIRL
jgi:hypothetical protein